MTPLAHTKAHWWPSAAILCKAGNFYTIEQLWLKAFATYWRDESNVSTLNHPAYRTPLSCTSDTDTMDSALTTIYDAGALIISREKAIRPVYHHCDASNAGLALLQTPGWRTLLENYFKDTNGLHLCEKQHQSSRQYFRTRARSYGWSHQL